MLIVMIEIKCEKLNKTRSGSGSEIKVFRVKRGRR